MNPNSQTVYLEVRQAAGGDEAKIWASDLIRMYLRYAVKCGWKALQVDEGTLKISGHEVFDALKNESGVHRVQRIPATEKRGRVHTSTATVAVVPQISQSQIQVNQNDLDWQFYRSGGHGGQNVNKVSTAVRLIHRPTGIVVTAQTERFQEQNRKIALDLLNAKLYQLEEEKKKGMRNSYVVNVGIGDRAEKIRTYNFPQNRLTDHRIGKSFHNLEDIIEEGKWDKVFST